MIKNKTKNTIIAEGFKTCSNPLSKALGLMFTKRITKPLLFVFNRRQNIPLHMLFVFYPIDVMWLDQGKVVHLKENFRPFRTYNPKTKATHVLELPNGTIKSSKTIIGDQIDIKK